MEQLSELARNVLELAQAQQPVAARLAAARVLGLSVWRYWQLLNSLIDDPLACAAYPGDHRSTGGRARSSPRASTRTPSAELRSTGVKVCTPLRGRVMPDIESQARLDRAIDSGGRRMAASGRDPALRAQPRCRPAESA